MGARTDEAAAEAVKDAIVFAETADRAARAFLRWRGSQGWAAEQTPGEARLLADLSAAAWFLTAGEREAALLGEVDEGFRIASMGRISGRIMRTLFPFPEAFTRDAFDRLRGGSLGGAEWRNCVEALAGQADNPLAAAERLALAAGLSRHEFLEALRSRDGSN